MKRISLLIFLAMQLLAIQGQERVFLTTSKKSSFYIELNGDSGFVFNVGGWIDKAGTANSFFYIDTIKRQPAGSPNLFVGTKTSIQRVNNKLYLTAPAWNLKKIKTVQVDTVYNTDHMNSEINNAYWWDNFLKMQKKIDSTYELFHYSFRNGFYYWNSFTNKTIDYKIFEVFAIDKLRAIRDSIDAVQTVYVKVTENLIKNITTIDYSSLKQELTKLPAEYGAESQYFMTVVRAIADHRPELYFQLAQDVPDKKSIIFSSVDDISTIKKLKAVETSIVTKKEFFKEKRFEKNMPVKAILASLAGVLVLGVSILALTK